MSDTIEEAIERGRLSGVIAAIREDEELSADDKTLLAATCLAVVDGHFSPSIVKDGPEAVTAWARDAGYLDQAKAALTA